MIGPSRYVEVDKNLFREVNGNERVAFQENAEGEITGMVHDGMGVWQEYRTPFYETTQFIGVLVGLPLLILLGVLLRLCFNWPGYKSLAGAEKNARRASVLLAVLNILFFIVAGIAVSGGILSLMYALPTLLKVSFVFPILATLAALYHVYQSAQVWRQPVFGSAISRIGYSIVTLAGLALKLVLLPLEPARV